MEEHVSLRAYNTFGVNCTARYYAAFSSCLQLEEILTIDCNEQLVLGGGSNILFTQPYQGCVLHNKIMGIELVREEADFIYIKVGGGVVWQDFVDYCIERNYAGIENLSLIPGTVGASPIQNIGAYGVEVKDILCSVDAFHLHDRSRVTFNAEDCAFGYRNSVFKTIYKGQFVILSVTFRLRKIAILNLTYGALERELERMGVQSPSIQTVAEAVKNIRRSKLPDPREVGNAGSFFKNPEITKEHFEALTSKHPGITGFEKNGYIKIAAGWLIEQAGWKGYRRGYVGCHPDQALVLVNYGAASGKEVRDLSIEIVESVSEMFGIRLACEVNIL